MYPGRHIHLSVVLCGLMEFTLCTVIRIITPFLCHHPGIMWRPATERQAHRETALIAGKAVIRLPLILFQNDNKTLFRFLFRLLIKSRKPLSIDTSGKRALTQGNLSSLKVIQPKRAKILLHSKSRNFTGVCMVGGKNLPPPPPTLQLLNTTTLRSYICASFQQIAFLIGSFTDHNAFFPVVLTDFSLTGRRQKSK